MAKWGTDPLRTTDSWWCTHVRDSSFVLRHREVQLTVGLRLNLLNFTLRFILLHHQGSFPLHLGAENELIWTESSAVMAYPL